MGVKLGNGNWAVKEDKLLAYNDNSGRFFNKEFDFSRGSSATYVAKDGLIKTAGLQTTNLVNNGDFSELGSELVVNGNFNTDSDWTKGTGWSISSGKANCDGSQSGNANIYQSITFSVGKIYKVSFDVSNYVSGTVKIVFGDTGGTVRSANGNYVQYFTFASGSNFYIQGNSSFIGSVDNVSVKQVDPNDYWTLGGNAWSITDKLSADGTQTTGTNSYQSQTFDSGKTYKVVFTCTIQAGNLDVRLQGGGSTVLGTTHTTSGTYTQLLTSTGNTSLRFRGNEDFIGTIDNVSVQEIQTDTPRIDFSDSVKGALLLEPQSTNLLTQSEYFEGWSRYQYGGGSLTQTFGYASPEGNNNAYKWDIVVGTGGVLLTQNTTITASVDYTLSVWMKGEVGGEKLRIDLKNTGSSGEIGQIFTLTTEWVRYNVTITNDSGTSRGFQFRMAEAVGTSDQTIYVWGAQLEEKSFVTSYIPNHGVSGGVTRLADVCNNSGSAQDFNSEEGTLYAEIAALADDGTSRRISLSNGSTSNTVEILFQNTGTVSFQVKSGNSFQGGGTFNLTQTEFNKIAVKYKANDLALWVNGSERSTDTSANTPIGLSELAFDNGGGGSYFYGKVRELQVFTEALTDEQLQKLTTI